MSKRGRKPSKVDVKVKLERSRQSARECRARKKLRYQYVEELVTSWEKAIFSLRSELDMCKKWCKDLDNGKVNDGLKKWLVQSNIKIESSVNGKKGVKRASKTHTLTRKSVVNASDNMDVKEEPMFETTQQESQEVPNVGATIGSTLVKAAPSLPVDIPMTNSGGILLSAASSLSSPPQGQLVGSANSVISAAGSRAEMAYSPNSIMPMMTQEFAKCHVASND